MKTTIIIALIIAAALASCKEKTDIKPLKRFPVHGIQALFTPTQSYDIQ